MSKEHAELRKFTSICVGYEAFEKYYKKNIENKGTKEARDIYMNNVMIHYIPTGAMYFSNEFGSQIKNMHNCFDKLESNLKEDRGSTIELEKKQVISLIMAYGDKDHDKFKKIVFDIAKEFDNLGDYQLSEHIIAQVGHAAWSIND